MDKSNTNSEYRTDYLDIVNEINDFIASLDAPPLDNHTKELVGTSDRPKFGQHGTDLPAFIVGNDVSSSRSRHASGDNNVSSQFFVPKISSDIDYPGNNDETLYESSFPFPCAAETNQEFPIYENMVLDSSRSADGGEYSDLSNYGGAFSDSSSSGELADSDSGCYSQYQKLKSDGSLVDKGSPVDDMLSNCSPVTASSSSLPNTLSGYTRGLDSPVSPYSSSSSSPSPSHHKQQHTRPQSPDRLSAEFLCDPDPLDLRFHQAGSSAHTLASSLGKYTPKDSRLAEPGSCPKVPDSPVPKRKPPFSFLRSVESSTQHPLVISSNTHSTSLHLPAASQHSQQSEQDVSYSVIKKPTPSIQPSHLLSQKQSIKNRWPPSVDNQNSSSSSVSPQLDSNTAITPLDKPSTPTSHQNLQTQESVTEKSQLPIGAGSSSPNPTQHVPDLSLLISELRSASPRSELSPTSTYTSSARSESISPKPLRAPLEYSTGQAQEPQQPAQLSLAHTSRFERSEHTKTGAKSDQAKTGTGHCPLEHRSDQHTTGVGESACLSKTVGPTNCLPHRSESPEHDYEPIENLQLEIPATPRPQPKFPHPQGQAMAETGGQQPKHVKALHNFKGKNNDELCFKKGDIITVTQCEDRDWWEGTLNGRTGWFPCNYTKEVKTDISFKNKPGDVPVFKRESMQLYHNVVLKNIIETEKTHVTEMVRVLQSYIKPLESANILSTAEFNLLVGNVEEIIALQQSLLATLEDCEKQPSSQRKIGGIFMQFAPTVKELYSTYCANHPKAVSVLQKKREELGKFVESQGALSPGAQTLTTILSKPFTRLEKYPSLLKELERHVEESHPDRGDTQRAIAVYRNIANSCMEIRKLKEMEFEIITSTIQGWEGEDICKLGEVIHLSLVKMITQTGEKYERIFVLFSSCLVMLSMSARLSSYHYEGKIPLSGLIASPTETAEHFLNAFEILGPMIEKITVICGTKMEVAAWLDIINQQVSQSGNPVSATKPQPLQVHMTSTGQTTVSAVTPAKTAQISHVTSNPPSAPPPHYPQVAKTSTVWSMSCLRPSPPVRPNLMCREEVLKSPRAGRKVANKRKPDDPKVYNEDAFILQVIEAYCNSIKTRHTVNSSILNSPSPHVLLAEEEKIFDENEQQERTVVDTVYALQDRVKELEQEQRKLRQELEEEKRCRKKLEILVRAQVNKSNIVDGIQDGSS